MPMNRMMQFLK